jgi:hypothetical protein
MRDAKAEMERFQWLRLKEGTRVLHFCPVCRLKTIEIRPQRVDRPSKGVALAADADTVRGGTR